MEESQLLMLMACALLSLWAIGELFFRTKITLSDKFFKHQHFERVCTIGFRGIPGFPGYSVNEWSLVRGRSGNLLTVDRYGRVTVHMLSGKSVCARPEHLALIAFYGLPPHRRHEVHFIDNNPSNRHVANMY